MPKLAFSLFLLLSLQVSSLLASPYYPLDLAATIEFYPGASLASSAIDNYGTHASLKINEDLADVMRHYAYWLLATGWEQTADDAAGNSHYAEYRRGNEQLSLYAFYKNKQTSLLISLNSSVETK